MRRIALALLIGTGSLLAQSPFAIPFTCHDDDLQWAGLSCTDTDCPIYLELTHSAGLGSSILLAGDLHATSATLASVLLRSTDGGSTWTEPFERLRGGELNGIQVYDPQTAWVGGETLQPLPMDPFLLHTTDGGKSWERVPLFEEGTAGSLAAFHFDTRERGRVVIARAGEDRRYQTYETQSGGREWTLVGQSDDLPTLKPNADTEWRVRPETKLFRLEHYEEGIWKPFASFALNAGSCRETPPADRPEPISKP